MGYPPRHGTGYPPPPETDQHSEHLLRAGRYASCVHAGGLSCYYFIFVTNGDTISTALDNQWLFLPHAYAVRREGNVFKLSGGGERIPLARVLFWERDEGRGWVPLVPSPFRGRGRGTPVRSWPGGEGYPSQVLGQEVPPPPRAVRLLRLRSRNF